MSTIELNELRARVDRLQDGEIIKALASPGDYTPEAMAVYESEANRRCIRSEMIRPVARQEAQKRRDQVATAWSFKGIGLTFHGMRSFRGDGSYKTTKWFVFLHLPIYPLCSLRVKPADGRGCSVLEVLPIDWRQVVDTYCFIACSWAVLAGAWRLIESHPFPFSNLASVALLGLPLLYLYLIRLRARKNAEAKEAGNKLPARTSESAHSA